MHLLEEFGVGVREGMEALSIARIGQLVSKAVVLAERDVIVRAEHDDPCSGFEGFLDL